MGLCFMSDAANVNSSDQRSIHPVYVGCLNSSNKMRNSDRGKRVVAYIEIPNTDDIPKNIPKKHHAQLRAYLYHAAWKHILFSLNSVQQMGVYLKNFEGRILSYTLII